MHAFYMPHSLNLSVMMLWRRHILNTRHLAFMMPSWTSFLLLLNHILFSSLRNLSSSIVSDDGVLLHFILWTKLPRHLRCVIVCPYHECRRSIIVPCSLVRLSGTRVETSCVRNEYIFTLFVKFRTYFSHSIVSPWPTVRLWRHHIDSICVHPRDRAHQAILWPQRQRLPC